MCRSLKALDIYLCVADKQIISSSPWHLSETECCTTPLRRNTIRSEQRETPRQAQKAGFLVSAMKHPVFRGIGGRTCAHAGATSELVLNTRLLEDLRVSFDSFLQNKSWMTNGTDVRDQTVTTNDDNIEG